VAMSNPLPVQLLDIESNHLHHTLMIVSKVTNKGLDTAPSKIREDGAAIKCHQDALASFAVLASSISPNVDFQKARKKARKDWSQHATREGGGVASFDRDFKQFPNVDLWIG
jgi:hypothetical protein